jgi:hypothetical protein
MSLVDEARTVRQRIVERIRELEPLVQEYEELKLLAAEMGIDEAFEGAELHGHHGRGRRAARGAHEGAGESTTSELRELVLRAVEADPGKTIAEYAEVLGVASTSLYRPVRELTNSGELVKRARQLFLS